MEINKVLLIVPRYQKSRYRPVLQAGIGYVAQALLESSVEYKYLDMGFSDSARKLPRILKTFKPDFIGISTLTFRYKDHYQLVKELKRVSRQAIIGLGGAHTSLFGESIFEDCPGVDVVFKKEAEGAIVDFCKGLDNRLIKGLLWRDDVKVFSSPEPALICELDKVSFPRYQGFPLNRYVDKEFNILPIVSSRGCPNACSYCTAHLSMGYKVRMRSATNIADEIEYWYALGYHRFGICDDNFTYDRRRVIDLCEEIKKRKITGLKLSCDNGIRADRVDYDMLKIMKEAGFWRLAFGIEAGNDRVLSAINKNLNTETARKAIGDACALGYTVRLFFLIGSPSETWRDFKDSIKLAKEYPIFDASFYNVIPYPKTALYEWIKKHGYFVDSPENYLHYATGKINIPVFYTKDFTLKDRKKAFNYARRVSLSINRLAIRRKLQGIGFLGRAVSTFYFPGLINRLLEWRFSRRIIINMLRGIVRDVLEESPQEVSYEVRERYQFSEKPRVSVIIPSLDGKREGNLAMLVSDFKNQTYKDFEIIVVKNISPQGKAINVGVGISRGDVLLVADDDSRMNNPRVIENLLQALDSDRTIGMAGASILVSPDANWLQRRAGKEFPRFGMNVVNRVTESDMACHGCCAIPRNVFEEVGRERENILRGLDPDLRFRMRQKGYKTVIAPNTWVYHPLPATFGKFIKTFFRNGMGSAYCLKFQPDLIYDTDEELELKNFKAKIPFWQRILRYPFRVFKSILDLRFLRFISYLVYAFGFYYGIIIYSLKKNSK